MSVDYYANLKYGYKVRYEDVPDAYERFYNEFSDCADENDEYMVTVCGIKMFCDELVSGDNAYEDYEDEDWYIGINLPCSALPEEILSRCKENDDLVMAMYELVMRKPPTERPMVFSYLSVW